MHREDAFQVEGVIVEVMPNNTCWVQLANGHRLRGFAPGRLRQYLKDLSPGSKVRVQLSAFDLSEGRLLLNTETI